MNRRGLTLLETLLAAALLAALAAAAAPSIARAMETLRSLSPASFDDELIRVADAFCERLPPQGRAPGSRIINVKEQLRLLKIETNATGSVRSVITIKPMQTSPAEGEHAWIVFERDGQRAYRWIRLLKSTPPSSRSERER